MFNLDNTKADRTGKGKSQKDNPCSSTVWRYFRSIRELNFFRCEVFIIGKCRAIKQGMVIKFTRGSLF